jgi:hypothetical protein
MCAAVFLDQSHPDLGVMFERCHLVWIDCVTDEASDQGKLSKLPFSALSDAESILALAIFPCQVVSESVKSLNQSALASVVDVARVFQRLDIEDTERHRGHLNSERTPNQPPTLGEI